MADSTVGLPPLSGPPGDKLDAEQLVVGTETVKRERIQVAGDGASDVAEVDPTYGLAVDVQRLPPGVPDLSGTWSYYAGISGMVNVGAGERVLGIAARSATGGSLSIDGGPPVPIPAEAGISISPQGKLVGPSIVFSGTDSYFVEVLS